MLPGGSRTFCMIYSRTFPGLDMQYTGKSCTTYNGRLGSATTAVDYVDGDQSDLSGVRNAVLAGLVYGRS